MRRLAPLVILLLGIAAAFHFWPRSERAVDPDATTIRGHRTQNLVTTNRPDPAAPSGNEEATRRTPPAPAGSGPAGRAYDEADFPIAAPLNAPGSTVGRDLDIVSQILDAWRSNFPVEGNPVGENAEITAALMGDNRLGLALIPRGHPAVNAAGELCDRWGTPLRFHQLSGTRMEIQSAGPDRKFATADDAKWTPE